MADKSIKFTIGTPRPKHVIQHHGGPHVSFQLRDSEELDLAVTALDSEGNPANADIAWTSSDETIVSVLDHGDGTATIQASPGEGGLGDATVTATATDRGDGDTLTGTFDVTVIAGDAVAVNIAPVGDPRPKA